MRELQPRRAPLKSIMCKLCGFLAYSWKLPAHSGAFFYLQMRILAFLLGRTMVYPYPLALGAGAARPDPKMGAPDPENPLFLGFSVLRGGLRRWSQTMARPWGRGRSGDSEKLGVW